MGSVSSRNGKLYLDFRYEGVRCREQTALPDTQANQRKLQKLLNQIEADIRLSCFVYSEYFPQSNRAKKFVRQDLEAQRKKEELLGNYKTAVQELQGIDTILFEDFSEEWYEENEVRWKESYKENMRIYLGSYLVPRFGHVPVDKISRPDILKFRAELVKPRENGKKLSADFINHIMTPLRMIINEAADRYGFRSSFENIKQLRVEKRDVNPFDLNEVTRFLKEVKPDYKDYFTVRFFTGMRTSEIDGLKWKYVNFKMRTISVRETIVQGRTETTKTIGSSRDIQMSSVVFSALQDQFRKTGNGEYVFCNAAGNPLDKGNIRDRVWKPTLKRLGMEYRRPYETRHTAASLWLAAGEAPEWIARQMGHTNTKMLFEIYSRFVPNLTRQDGSAFEKLLNSRLDTEDDV
ncbi:site-specific integrase [Vibrio albus]|uniref:Site-specific integrase n=1 Tax=Vibrio albus TaxID=2200953 RepID=A0A2U3BD71_9VIBR|nr:site-specific integrase [Vibrio albus]PWI34723.1 site-specific integrase [Vibrio albus]